MKEAARDQAIDILRGASAIAVGLFHFNQPYPKLSDAYHRVWQWGWLGVPVFFVVSGFCIAAARQKSGPVAFWFRRLARIFPPYWASVLLILGLIGLRITTNGTNDIAKLPQDPAGWAYTIAGLTSPASWIPSVNWAYWSLGYELAFYILMGALVWRSASVLLCLFSVLAFFIPGYPFDLWGLFGLGIACYYYTARQYYAAAVLGSICLTINLSSLYWPQVLVSSAAALVILFPPAASTSPFLRPLRQAGVFSYSFYLTHVPIGCYLLPHYLPWTLDRRFWPSLLQDSILLTGSLLFACLFYRVVEKPSHDFARRVQVGTPKPAPATPLGMVAIPTGAPQT